MQLLIGVRTRLNIQLNEGRLAKSLFPRGGVDVEWPYLHIYFTLSEARFSLTMGGKINPVQTKLSR